ncbi:MULTISPECIES: glutathione S-transferase family protein [Marinobacter]|uniref:Glutathione S-transferase n=1 Tax=Marinobacter profundi TaxID=2666256 RepID=A0A2G1UNC7_9GAMM|nr:MULTISPECIES: glutathione S-transferase family protein [Marinobacter]MBD3655049.1 glutathione S-transferase family protein [Marinobacter sp.]PHQ15963.1 glutathione S-transferase [Marinobacter profundi]
MSELTFYSNPMSRGRIVRWMLEELDVPYQLEIVEFGSAMKSPDYLAINPMGKVPAIRHGTTVVTEVAAICAYLADQFPQQKLAPPPQSPERGTYYRWLFFMAGPFEMATSARAYGWRIDEKNVQAVGCGHIEDSANALEQALARGPFICGEQFTAADVVVSSYLGWEMMQKNLDPRPVFQDYVERSGSRPAARRANELDNALIKQTP